MKKNIKTFSFTSSQSTYIWVGKLAYALEGYIGVNMYQKKLFKLQGKKDCHVIVP